MPLEEVIAGFTGTGFATTPPTIPGLTSLGIFGTSRDGKNTNRVGGGAAFSNLTNPPTYGTAWGTFNSGTQTPTQGLDTNVVETTAIRDAGWTWFCIARMSAASGTSILISSNGAAQSCALTLTPQLAALSNHPSIYYTQQAFAFDANTQAIDLGAGTPVNTWRMYGVTYPAGTVSRPFTVFDVTGARQQTSANAPTRVANGHFFFGNNGASVPTSWLANDQAVSGICTQPLTLAQLQSIRTWLLGVLAPRGVTGF